MNDRGTRSRTWRAQGMTFLGATAFVLGSAAVAQRPGSSSEGTDQTRVAEHVTSSAARSAAELLARRVSVTLENVSLEQALDKVSRVANVFVQYQIPALAPYGRPVTLHATNMSLGEVLERVLDGTALRVEPGAQGHLTIVAAPATGADSIETGTIAGRVIDSATKRALRGATVKVAGTKLGVIANDSGQFVLRGVPAGSHLVTAKLFGYRAREQEVAVKANERVTIRIVLPAAPNLLSGVVTTAAGEQERRSLGNDITVLNADSITRVAPITSVTDLLENRVPGLTVQRTSGTPGAPSRIRLRGVGGGLVPGASNTSNDPIVVVDGIRVYARQSTARDQDLAPRNNLGTSSGHDIDNTYAVPSALDQIDPNSIDKIEVFKGPSATSKWGADAGNGVIVITTKRGQAGQTRLGAALDAGLVTMPGQYAAPGYYPFGPIGNQLPSPSRQCQLFPLGNGAAVCTGLDSVARFQAANVARLSPFATGSNQAASVTLSGGSAALTYSMTGSAQKTLGYFKMPAFYRDLYAGAYGTAPPAWATRPDRYKTWSANTSLGVTPREGLRVELVTSVYRSVQHQTAGHNLSYLSGKYLDTAGLLNPTLCDTACRGTEVASYLDQSTSTQTNSTGNVTVNWTGWSFLPVQATAGVNNLARHDEERLPFGVYDLKTDTLGLFSTGRGVAVTQNGRVLATFLPGRTLSAAIGADVAATTTEDVKGYQDTLQAGVSTPSALKGVTQSSFASTTAGWWVEPQVAFLSRFFAAPGFRFDGGSASSRTGDGSVLSLFPHLNFSWIAVDPDGRPALGGVLTLLRPRIALGVAGVQPDPTWRYRTAGQTTDPNFNGSTTPPLEGIQIKSLGNTALRPERSREFEGGFDAGLWGGRINLTASGYYKLRIDAIQEVATARSVYGGMPYYLNIGRVRNTGTELTMDARLVETGAVAWGVNASLSANRNALTSLSGSTTTQTLYAPDGTQLRQGYPIGGRWSRPIVGYHDSDGNGRISLSEVAVADTPVYVGDGQPSIHVPFGTNLSFAHGAFSINAAFDYTGGVTQYNGGGAQLLYNLYQDPNATPGQQAIAVAAAACQANIVNGCTEFSGTTRLGTDYGLIQTVSTLRFDNLSLNYVVPRSVGARLHLPPVAVSLRGQNLKLWTNYRGKDPDVNATTFGEGLADNGQLPLPRNWSVHVTLGQ